MTRAVPKQYQALYKRAMSGKSRKAAMKIQCIECCGWQIAEVFVCADSGCSLWPYRPAARTSQGAPESIRGAVEPPNAGCSVLFKGS